MSWLNRLGDALLTTDRVLRIRLTQSGLAMVLMTASVLTLHYVRWIGLAPAVPVWWWTLAAMGGMATFFGLIRSGWTRRLADPSLTLPQMLYGIACAAVAYALAGPPRGGVFPVLMVILMFGMFQLDARRVAVATVYAMTLFGGMMAFMAWHDPTAYRPEVELSHFLAVGTMLPAVSILAARLSRLRARLVEQKAQLGLAATRNQELATRDELTGLLNRRHMQQLLEQERLRCLRTGSVFCVALIDIDHFKRVNDQHGHAVGDEVLRGFAREAQAALRSVDVLARWGGDEFVLMLTDARVPLARAGLDRVCERVRAMSTAQGGAALGITVSCGLTEHIPGEATSRTLERADAALYRAKADGRNRLVLA